MDAELDPCVTDGEALLRGCLDAPGDPGPLLVYADWLEEQGGAYAPHAVLVRRVTGQTWEWVGRREHRGLRLGPFPLAEVAWWGREGLWFWKAAGGGKGNKGAHRSREGAVRAALECLLRHRWPASSCPCTAINP